MKAPRFGKLQIALARREAEQGTPAAEVCRSLGVTWEHSPSGAVKRDRGRPNPQPRNDLVTFSGQVPYQELRPRRGFLFAL